MVNIFGIELSEGLFYTLSIMGTIFYCFMLWFILQILRKKMPIRVQKLDVGQSMTEHKGKEDDLKIYWREGFYGKVHEALKVTKARLQPHWGRTVKKFLVREDYNATVPYAKGYRKLEDINLCNKCLDTLPKSNPEPVKIDLSKLCNDCLNKINIIESKPLLEVLKSVLDREKDKDVIEKAMPESITVNFLSTDELKGQSTEATTKRRNEDFIAPLGRIMRKVQKGDMLLGMIMGLPLGFMVTFIILMASGVLQIG